MSKLPITHCEHGIDRAYRCIDCIEAERDALRAQVEELDRRLHETSFEAGVLRLSRGHARRELAALRASIAALADEWERVAARAPEQVYVTAWQETLAECATKLRQLAEDNSATAQEGL